MSETNFTKLFSSITASTIWCESPETKVVWITMLAMADAAGFVYASVPGLANIAQVPIDQTREALAKFLDVDPDSRDSENEGQRIEEIDGGWAILNHPKYRKIRNAEERKAYHREYMRKKRAEKGQFVKSGVNNVKDCEPQLTQEEGEAEADKDYVPTVQVKTPRSFPVPAQEIVNKWNEFALANRLPQVVKVTNTLRGQIRQRWTDIPSLDKWDNFFSHIAANDFLAGRTQPGNGRSKPFRSTLLWITKETNFAKIAAGEYD